MQLTGILRTWHDDRGYGFIAPTHGGAELFVHISAFPRDGSRPVAGESLSYEAGRGENGKLQAVRVVRLAVGAQPPRRGSASTAASPAVSRAVDAGRRRPAIQPRRAQPRRLPTIATLLLVLVCASYVYTRFVQPSRLRAEPTAGGPLRVQAPAQPAPGPFRCDGRVYCSQMTSCAEATFFLNHCPGTKMDGNHDGVPCEQQWCSK